MLSSTIDRFTVGKGFWRLSRAQTTLAAVVLVVTLFELALAKKTHGTYDINIWESFAKTVDRVGPIKIYSLDQAGLMVYNHPPLIGWWLMVVNGMQHLGVTPGSTIRAATTVAHALTSFLILDMLRRRVSLRLAWFSALAVALSPTLIIISGFHGNNDPIVALLTIASVYLLVDRRMPLLAGVAFSLAMSIKIVPIMVIPLMAVAAWRLGGRRELTRFALGGVPVFLLLWVPVLLLAGKGFLVHVIGYNGSGFPRQWGLYQLGKSAGLSSGVLAAYAGLGTYLVIGVCALLPAWFIRNNPERAPAALGLCLSMFLLLTPGWATQYNAYVAAAVFLIEFWSAMVFTVGGGIVYLTLYYQWRGDVQTLKPYQIPILFVAWLSLIPSVVTGLRLFLRSQPSGTDAATTTQTASIMG